MMFWTTILRMLANLTSYAQAKAQAEQWRKANLPAKVTIVAPSQPLNNSLAPSVNVSKQLGGQVGYPAHSQKGTPLDVTSPKPDLADGPDENKLIEQGLKEINQIVSRVNERQRSLSTADIQAEANWQLDNYLNNYDKVSPSLREIENEAKIPKN